MARFDLAIPIVLGHEGGYVNDPDDAGGATKFGISQRSYPDIDIADLTVEQATDIYLEDFWNRYPYDAMWSQRLANVVFDIAVNIGSRRAHRMLQVAINEVALDIDHLSVRVVTDGIMGPITVMSANSLPSGFLVHTFQYHVKGYYKSLSKPKYLKGWLNRLFDEG